MLKILNVHHPYNEAVRTVAYLKHPNEFVGEM